MNLLLLGLGARAAEPLVYDGDVGRALQRTALATGRPLEDFAPRPASEIAATPAALVGGAGLVTACPVAPLSAEQVLLGVQAAEGALAYGEAMRAREEVVRIEAVLACPPEPFDPTVLARYFVVRARTGDADGWRLARAIDPFLAFDEDWGGAEERAAFDAAAPARSTLTVTQPGIRIDGRAVEERVDLAPGWHALASAKVRAGVVLDGPGGLVLPAELPPAWLSDPKVRAPATAALAAAYGEGVRVFVATDDGVWAATTGRTDWLPIGRTRAHALVPSGLAVAGAGALGAAVTGAIAASRYAAARDAVTAVETASTVGAFEQAGRDHADADAAYRAVRWLPALGGGLAVVGLGLTGTGFAIGPVIAGGAP